MSLLVGHSPIPSVIVLRPGVKLRAKLFMVWSPVDSR